jgi:hypothetical protein
MDKMQCLRSDALPERGGAQPDGLPRNYHFSDFGHLRLGLVIDEGVS